MLIPSARKENLHEILHWFETIYISMGYLNEWYDTHRIIWICIHCMRHCRAVYSELNVCGRQNWIEKSMTSWLSIFSLSLSFAQNMSSLLIRYTYRITLSYLFKICCHTNSHCLLHMNDTDSIWRNRVKKRKNS